MIQGILNILNRTVVMYLLCGIALSLLMGRDRIAGNYLAHTKDYGDYAYQFSYGKMPKDDKRLKQSVVYFDALKSFLPSPALVYGNLGFCFYHLGDFKRAAEHYEKAIHLEPQLYSFYYDLGLILMQAQQYDQAIHFFKASLSLIPQKKEGYMKLIRSVNIRADKDSFEREMEQMFARAKYDREQLFKHLASAYYQKKDLKSMREIALKASQLFPNPSAQGDFSELHVYRDAGLFFKMYSLQPRN